MSNHIELICGPMFAGKTTELMRRIQRLVRGQKKCIVLKYAGDTRYTSDCKIMTHDQLGYDAIPIERLPDAFGISDVRDHELNLILDEVEVIGIDEGQFFPSLTEFCSYWCSTKGKTLIVSALNLDYRGKAWPVTSEVSMCAESVTLLTSVCGGCGRQDAIHTGRRRRCDEKWEVSEISNPIHVGGEDEYVALCRTCFHQNSTLE